MQAQTCRRPGFTLAPGHLSGIELSYFLELGLPHPPGGIAVQDTTREEILRDRGVARAEKAQTNRVPQCKLLAVGEVRWRGGGGIVALYVRVKQKELACD